MCDSMKNSRVKLVLLALNSLLMSVAMSAQESKEVPEDWVIAGTLAALDDKYDETKRQALRDIVKWKIPPADLRSRAVQVLGERAVLDLVRKMTELLKDDRWPVRQAALEALGALGAKGQAGKIAELLKDSDRRVRWTAVRALGALGAKEQAGKIAEWLKDGEPYIRRAAAEALGALGAKEQAHKIAELLKDDDPDVRGRAAEALGALEAKDHADKIAELLKDDDPHVRGRAAEALGALEAKDHADEIAELLKDGEHYVRRAAARALGALEAKEHVDKIVEVLKDGDRGVRRTATQALVALGAKEQAGKIAEWLEDDDEGVRRTAAEALRGLGAKGQAGKIAELLKDSDRRVRWTAVRALGALGAKEQADKIAELLTDDDADVRLVAAEALGALGATEQADKIAEWLKDDDEDVRQAAAEALRGLGPFGVNAVMVLDGVHDDPPLAPTPQVRYLAYVLGGESSDVRLLLRWIGRPEPDALPRDFSRNQALQYLSVFDKGWPSVENYDELRRELGTAIASVTRDGFSKFNAADVQLFTESQNLNVVTQLAERLEEFDNTKDSAAAVRQIVAGIAPYYVLWQRVLFGRNILAGQAAVWLVLLIFLYPKYRPIQAIFFWNPWVRRIGGFGYVGLLLRWVPFLRRRLFAPFRDSLVSEARLEEFSTRAYFAGSDVQQHGSEEAPIPIDEAIPAINGQIILQGESGLGKTMFLRHLVSRTERINVYLEAKDCSHGVVPAIQQKLHGLAADEKYLRDLIFAGALDICVDGLNEVSPHTRVEISQFARSFFRGNLLMATQPMIDWEPPPTAKRYLLLPLTRQKIEEFLVTREPTLGENSKLRGAAYEEASQDFLNEMLAEDQPNDELKAKQMVLSNPMDLTTVASMLGEGAQPDLFLLQQQQYELMATDLEARSRRRFPLQQFSETVFEMRRDDEDRLPQADYPDEITAMERHKMVLRRVVSSAGDQNTPARTEWVFRHDKIMDFFIVQTFLGTNNDRPREYISDARFHGVYRMLASLMPLEEAKVLREHLIFEAAERNDNRVSNAFVQVLRSRQALARGRAA